MCDDLCTSGTGCTSTLGSVRNPADDKVPRASGGSSAGSAVLVNNVCSLINNDSTMPFLYLFDEYFI